MTTIYINPGDNIAEQSSLLQSGDTLTFRAGRHYGRLVMRVDGVTITGEPGAILEGTSALESDWTLALDSDGIASLAGSGTWRLPVPFQPWVLLDEQGGMLHRIDSDFVGVRDQNNYTTMSAYSALAVPDGARPGPDYYADWWEGIEALWTYNLFNHHLYVRYRDGRRPGQLRASGGHSDHRDPPFPQGSVIYLDRRRDIRIEKLQIRGSVDGVAIVDSRNIEIDSCILTGCDFGSRVYGFCQNIKITHNEFRSGLLGTNAVAPVSKVSTEDPNPESRFIVYHQYSMWKFWHDQSDSLQGSGVSVYNSFEQSTQTIHRPRNVEIAHNTGRDLAFAVDLSGGDGIDIAHNKVTNCWDMAFQRMVDGGRNIQIHDNEVHESGYCLMRWHASAQEAGDNYVYNNRMSDIDQVSDGSFHSRNPGGADANSQLRIWYYHNSYSGLNSIVIMDGMLSMPGFNAVNNVVSNAGLTVVASGWPSQVGVVDYNFISGVAGQSSGALGALILLRRGGLLLLKVTQNLRNAGGPIWPSNQIVTDFTLPAGHPAKGSGIDVSQPFVIDGVTYPPLPGFQPGYFQGARPDRGWIQRA